MDHVFVAMKLSIILPVLNDAQALSALLPSLQSLRARGAEVIVVDGGSHDESLLVANQGADRCLVTDAGRAHQQHTGALAAQGTALWFLHADSQVPDKADALINTALMHHAWGRFNVQLQGRPALLRVVASMMNLRSRWTGIATGDQGIFVRRETYFAVGGFPLQPLMEDIELSRRLKRVSRPACLTTQLVTSGRRWEQHGVWRTIFFMWWLRGRYWLGTSPEKLHALYYRRPT